MTCSHSWKNTRFCHRHRSNIRQIILYCRLQTCALCPAYRWVHNTGSHSQTTNAGSSHRPSEATFGVTNQLPEGKNSKSLPFV